MSMLSAQCDELRNAAEFYDGFKAANLMREAADTIWELRDDLQRANAENAKLRDENARLRSCLSDDSDNARQIMAENAKLLELCKELLDLCYDAYNQEWGWDDEWALAYERAKKLGVDA